MLLGIPYHAGRLFTAEWGPPQREAPYFCEIIAQVIALFRMPTFFLIAGYFAAMLLSRKPRSEWLASRGVRLALPIMAATTTLLPLQFLVDAQLATGPDAPALFTLWKDRLLTASTGWISHLWFLYDLLLYSVLIAVAWPGVRRLCSIKFPKGKLVAPFGTFLMIGGACACVSALLEPIVGYSFWGTTVSRLCRNAPFFLIGSYLFLNISVFERWLRWYPWQALVAALTIAAAAALTLNGQHYRPALVLSGCAAVSGCWLVLATMKRWGNSPNPHVKLFVDASLTIYLVHHPLILALGLVTPDWSESALTKWLFVVMITGTASIAIYLLLRRFPRAYFYFNGQRRPAA